MRITAIETLRAPFHDNLLWVHVETDAGLTGLGETFFAPAAVEAWIHEIAVPLLVGADATRIAHWNATLMRQPGPDSGSMRSWVRSSNQSPSSSRGRGDVAMSRSAGRGSDTHRQRPNGSGDRSMSRPIIP